MAEQKNQQKPEGDDVAALKAALEQANADKAALAAKVAEGTPAEEVAKLRADLAQANADKAAAEQKAQLAETQQVLRDVAENLDGATRIVVAIGSVLLKGGKLKGPGSEFELPADHAAELVADGAVLFLEDYEAEQQAKAKAKGRPLQR